MNVKFNVKMSSVRNDLVAREECLPMITNEVEKVEVEVSKW